jgi:hypothetical protein|tara:strand:- start:4930 stop:5193 length:264 start_codon:yes stop_codon:yes gene_type:complete
MDKYIQPNDTASVWKNQNKVEGDKRPDFTGKLETVSSEVLQALSEGKPLQVAQWKRVTKNKKAFLFTKLSVIQEKPLITNDSEEEPF